VWQLGHFLGVILSVGMGSVIMVSVVMLNVVMLVVVMINVARKKLKIFSVRK
jgi:hypothetical protein